MATDTIIKDTIIKAAIINVTAAPSTAPNTQRSGATSPLAALADYWALTKPEINFLIGLATFTGFYLGWTSRPGNFPFLLFIHTLLGTLLVASGTGTLNQYFERVFDAQMRRTARRPLASGRMQPSSALSFGIFLSIAGAAYLAIAVNILACLLAVFTLLSYLFIYTPLKRKTPLCTLVGALPGAMPPLIGWAAATGRLSYEAWALYLILFLWQFPHFMAIAWMYRDDYDRAGYVVLPNGESRFRIVTLQCILPLLALFPVGLVPTSAAHAGILYFIGATLLGLCFFHRGTQFVLHRTHTSARRLLVASIIYLPSLFVLMILLRG
ncbi:MAG TPA: heme o synthase [Candidatus Deferrimicrobiaceae bacterium]|nr:heme o synthase [Candidatus Deferrimicrobiaceae bacterium]